MKIICNIQLIVITHKVKIYDLNVGTNNDSN